MKETDNKQASSARCYMKKNKAVERREVAQGVEEGLQFYLGRSEKALIVKNI